MMERERRPAIEGRGHSRPAPAFMRTPPGATPTAAIVALQRAAGNRAVARALASPREAPARRCLEGLLQRKILVQEARSYTSPYAEFRAYVRRYNFAQGARQLPARLQILTTDPVPRPDRAEAAVQAADIKDKSEDDARASGGLTGRVGVLGQMETYLTSGGAGGVQWQGGHLIGDRLAKGEDAKSMSYRNVAPQAKDLNNPWTSGFEDDIVKQLREGSTGSKKGKPRAAPRTFFMTAKLSYQGPLSIPAARLKQLGLIAGDVTNADALTFERRIPETWTLRWRRVDEEVDLPQPKSPGTPRAPGPSGSATARLTPVKDLLKKAQNQGKGKGKGKGKATATATARPTTRSQTSKASQVTAQASSQLTTQTTAQAPSTTTAQGPPSQPTSGKQQAKPASSTAKGKGKAHEKGKAKAKDRKKVEHVPGKEWKKKTPDPATGHWHEWTERGADDEIKSTHAGEPNRPAAMYKQHPQEKLRATQRQSTAEPPTNEQLAEQLQDRFPEAAARIREAERSQFALTALAELNDVAHDHIAYAQELGSSFPELQQSRFELWDGLFKQDNAAYKLALDKAMKSPGEAVASYEKAVENLALIVDARDMEIENLREDEGEADQSPTSNPPPSKRARKESDTPYKPT